jgi:hypothetical protein
MAQEAYPPTLKDKVGNPIIPGFYYSPKEREIIDDSSEVLYVQEDPAGFRFISNLGHGNILGGELAKRLLRADESSLRGRLQRLEQNVAFFRAYLPPPPIHLKDDGDPQVSHIPV